DGVSVELAKAAEAKLATGGPHKVTFLNEHDSVCEITLDHQLPEHGNLAKADLIKATRYSFVESKRLAGGIGYIHFTNFITPLKPMLQLAIGSMKDAPGLIIDLRGNSGGDSDMGLALAGMLFEKQTQLAITRTRK